MTYAQFNHKMYEHQSALNKGNLGLILSNFVLGLVTLDTLNLAVAFTGVFVTLMANIHRIVYSILWIVEVRRKGWKLDQHPQPKEPDPEEPKSSTTGT